MKFLFSLVALTVFDAASAGYYDFTGDKAGFNAAIVSPDWTVDFANNNGDDFEFAPKTIKDTVGVDRFVFEQIGSLVGGILDNDFGAFVDFNAVGNQEGFNNGIVMPPYAYMALQFPDGGTQQQVGVTMTFEQPVKAIGFDVAFSQRGQGTIGEVIIHCPGETFVFRPPDTGFWGIVLKDDQVATAIELNAFQVEPLFFPWEVFFLDNVLALIGEPKKSGAMGDPHFNTWANTWYDFHGICDLLFLQTEKLANGLGLQIQIRTKGRYQYSYIESAAVKIGDDILEVGSWGEHWFNGVEGAVEGADMPVIMGDSFPVSHTRENKKRQHFVITLDESKDEAIVVSTYKDIVSVMTRNATEANFGSSKGVLGKFEDGSLVGRDGVTVMGDDLAAFGQEWQVLASEPQLFQTPSPYLGKPCVPPVVTTGRRLGETISAEAAEKACAEYEGDRKDRCVFDVIAMADLEMAEVHGAY